MVAKPGIGRCDVASQSVEFTQRGPFFDKNLVKLSQEFADQASKLVAEHAVNMVTSRLDQVLQHPTGYYRSHIKTDRMSDGWRMSDSNVIYGPWLEGVGSRNATTQFKGYSTFRRVFQEISGIVDRTIEPARVKYMDAVT